jgi:hypothetical protein
MTLATSFLAETPLKRRRPTPQADAVNLLLSLDA